VNRIVLWVLSTVSSLVLLLGYHTSTAGPSPTSSVAARSTPSGGTAPGGTSPGTTVTGSVAATQWGPVQVQLVLDGDTITAVTVLQQPSGNPEDDEINSSALPRLVQETLDAQSADIDMVSGATVTSAGYLQSLQSALDQLGA
jgi:uncharacterized protein with FMN-binding domain